MMQVHQRNAYRLAYETANLELAQILGEIAKLHEQKDRVEKSLAAINPKFGLGGKLQLPITVH